MKAPAFQLYTGDWKKDPELGKCSPATRGIWIDLICAMHDDDRRGMVVGTVRELARLARCDSSEMETAIDELGKHHAAEIVRHENGLVTLINRRMFDEHCERKATQLRQQKHRDRSKYTAGHANVTAIVTPTSRQNNAVSSSSSSDLISLPRARVMDAFQRFGVLTPDAGTTAEVVRKIEDYAAAAKANPSEAADKAMDAFDRLSATWPVKRRTPALFLKHWEAIQEVMAGADPTPRQNSRAPPVDAPSRPQPPPFSALRYADEDPSGT